MGSCWLKMTIRGQRRDKWMKKDPSKGSECGGIEEAAAGACERLRLPARLGLPVHGLVGAQQPAACRGAIVRRGAARGGAGIHAKAFRQAAL
jgi:hypothetical protein